MMYPTPLLVWHIHTDSEKNEYFVSVEIRDYKNNYVVMCPVNRDWLTNLIKEMAIRDDKGYAYKKGVSGPFMTEGLNQ